MSDTNTTFINTRQLATKTGVAASTWCKHRLSGDGPAYIKAGGRVIYRWSDVEAWMSEQVRQSTSEAQ